MYTCCRGVRISQHVSLPVSLPAVQLVFGSQPRPATNPRGDVARFLTDFETLYGNTHPDFLQCSYAEVSSRGEHMYSIHYVYPVLLCDEDLNHFHSLYAQT